MMRAALACMVLFLAGCAPEPDFLDAQGRGHTFAELEGKWVVINYWATWCGPCIAEIKELNELHHGRDDLVVFGVNYDGEEGAVLDRQIAKMGINFPVFEGEVPDQYRFDFPLVLPTTHIVGPDGQLRETFVGPQTLATFDEAAGGSPAD